MQRAIALPIDASRDNSMVDWIFIVVSNGSCWRGCITQHAPAIKHWRIPLIHAKRAANSATVGTVSLYSHQPSFSLGVVEH